MVWVALALALKLLLIWFAPIRLHVAFHQRAWQADLAVDLIMPFRTTSKVINISSNVQMLLEHAFTRWFATGEPLKVPVQATLRRLPRKKLLRALKRPARWLGKRAEVKRLTLHGEVGGYDAMESALLSGWCWTLAGKAIAAFSHLVRLDPALPVVSIRPNFSQPVWRVSADCILRFRLGHAIVAVVWILGRMLRDQEIRLWARDSWRRKGKESGERAPDSRADEDRHGEPEGDGGRQYRHR